MYKEALQSIEGIGLFPVFGLLVFLVAFIGVVVWAARLDRETVSNWSNIPFDVSAKSAHEEEHPNG